MFPAAFRQQACYWAPSTLDGFGKRTFASPINIEVRWQIKEEELTDKEGLVKRSRSVVYCGRNLEEGGYLFLGSRETAIDKGITNPETSQNTELIAKVQKSPSLNGKHFFYKALTT